MVDKEKIHLIHIAYDNIDKVRNDTDEELWAREHLESALVALQDWFEESDV